MTKCNIGYAVESFIKYLVNQYGIKYNDCNVVINTPHGTINRVVWSYNEDADRYNSEDGSYYEELSGFRAEMYAYINAISLQNIDIKKEPNCSLRTLVLNFA